MSIQYNFQGELLGKHLIRIKCITFQYYINDQIYKRIFTFLTINWKWSYLHCLCHLYHRTPQHEMKTFQSVRISGKLGVAITSFAVTSYLVVCIKNNLKQKGEEKWPEKSFFFHSLYQNTEENVDNICWNSIHKDT